MGDEERPQLNGDEIRGQLAAIQYWLHRIEIKEGISRSGEDGTMDRLARD